MKKNAVRFNKGFTLTELLMTVVIVGVTLSIGLPSFQDAISNAKLTSSINALSGALQLARSEAIKKIKNAGVVPKVINGTKWTEGFIIFVDNDADGARNPDKSEDVQYLSLSTRIEATVTGFTQNDRLIYRPDGRINSIGGNFAFADANMANSANLKNCRLLSIANTGRLTCCKWLDSGNAWFRCDDISKQCTLSGADPGCPPS